MPPYSPNPEDSRPYYQQLRAFHDFLVKNLKLTVFDGYSMGMSSDFEVAIQEGSTCVRIGQAIFGPRSG
jgi:PLP dependent protein